MAKKKQEENRKQNFNNPNVIGLHSEVIEQPITETLEVNYMPYAMSVIVSRAIPEIDGFKPSHRKLLYTMYKMGLLNGARQKSANIVGRTMQLNPHGDAAIYETMVRLSAGHEALLAPFVDSKGNFGKSYSRDMSYAASRYTEAKLMPICQEIFKDIDKNTVDFVDSYDGTQKEPKLLPTTFPNVLVSANSGIAVGMASEICGFNLNEVCQTTIEYIKDPNVDLFSALPAPDFSTGGEIIFDRNEMESIYATGRGGFKVRAKWRYVQSDNIIEIYEIPYTTATDIIIDKIVSLAKEGIVREINDVRDETDLSGLKIAIDLKRGVDPNNLMQKLFKKTTLMDTFSCNFNILVDGRPQVLGIRQILDVWLKWRIVSIRNRVEYDLQKKTDKLHLLKGLQKILFDIDKAISIIRNTELEADVVPNLMVGFGIDKTQADFVAEIKLRNINREYILNRTSEIETLEKDIADLEDILSKEKRIKQIIIEELSSINKNYIMPRKSSIVFSDEIESYVEEEQKIDNYHCTVFLSKEGYFKKINDQSLRMSSEQKYKEGDSLGLTFEAGNADDILVFTNLCQVYKTRLSDFEDTKASALGVYLPTFLKMDSGEYVITIVNPEDYKKDILLFYENGKCGRVSLSSYETKTNRKKLINAFSDKSKLVSLMKVSEEFDVACYSDDDRVVVFNSSLLQTKTSKATIGVGVMTLKKNKLMVKAIPLSETGILDVSRYRVRNIPGVGALIKAGDREEKQLSFLD